MLNQKIYDIIFNDRHIEEHLADGRDGEYSADLVRLLRVLLSAKMEKNEKKQILSEEYAIPMTRELEGEVLEMCNLSRGIKEQGIQQGIQQGKMKIALELLKMKLPVENIINATELTLEQLKEIAQNNGLELVIE